MIAWMMCAVAGATPALPDLLEQELQQATAQLASLDEPPYYLALAVEQTERQSLDASAGALSEGEPRMQRLLDVDVRTGSPELDSTHTLRGFSALEGSSRQPAQLPVSEGSGRSLRTRLWRELDRQVRNHRERIVMIRANRNVKVEEEDPADDFIPREQGPRDVQPVPPLELDAEAWGEALVAASSHFLDDPLVHSDRVRLSARRVVNYFVDTEGSRLEHGRLALRLSIQVETVANDGDVVQVYRSVDVHDPARLPDPELLLQWAEEVRQELEELAAAPRGEPYTGPVLLSGKAAGVFFHEVFGHRVEGHRQKRESEGKTFAEYVGRPILPDFLDIYDDPRIAELEGEQLNGHYHYDDEGVPAQRADLVDDGTFVGFLMHRSPIPGFAESNGHGRRSPGRAPTARMGNTIIEADQTLPEAALIQRLRDEVREAGLEYGYVVEEIEGGFTSTGRVTPNAFNVRTSRARRVFADGRPDQLVRGIDLVGTPLVAFQNVLAAGEERAVFNGTCGAESGWVPVSAVAPSLLVEEMEFQLKEKGQERPPLLPKPTATEERSYGWHPPGAPPHSADPGGML